MNDYLQLKEETKVVNRALARTNLCVESLKKRIGKIKYNGSYLAENYGKELLLILQNYLIQKYHKMYGLYAEESYKDERLFFYYYSNGECNGVAGVFDMNKGKYYLSEHIVKSKDMLSSILNYVLNGFEEIEKQILRGLPKAKHIKPEDNVEITLTLYQLVTVGNCLGYFDVILISDELSNSEQFLMEEFKREKFLVRNNDKMFYIHKFTGELILSCGKRVEFKDWCNYNVGNGLEYIVKLQ